MGRPRKSEPRSQQFNLSFSVSEVESIRKRAAALGMRPAHFGRELLLTQTRALPKTAKTNHVDRLVYSQLARLGNNLNQIVRHLNRTGDPLPADLEPLLHDIRQIIARRCRDDR